MKLTIALLFSALSASAVITGDDVACYLWLGGATNSTVQQMEDGSYECGGGLARLTETNRPSAAQIAQWKASRLPTTFDSIAIFDTDTQHYYEAVPRNGLFLASQASDSPLTNAVLRAQRKAERLAEEDARAARIDAIKSSPEWEAMKDNLAQHDTHDAQWLTLRATATNAIAATTGANKTALVAIVNLMEKERQARDDAMTVAKKVKAILMDVAKEAR
jgi:hypothetical protein